MKYTLLELIQRILSSIKGEEVNSYDDTAESLVIRDIIKECYFSIIGNQDFPELKTLFELNASGDSSKPTLMTLPNDVLGLEWIKYDKKALGETAPKFEKVGYLPLSEFISRMHNLSTDDSNVGTFDVTTGSSDDIEFYYENDRPPMYYTSFDDKSIIFDAYDAAVDTTLRKSKTLCYGLKSTIWEDENTFVLPIDAQQYMILLKEAKAIAWEELRQTPNQTAAMQVRKAKIAAEKKKDRVNYDHKEYYYTRYPNYGRK